MPVRTRAGRASEPSSRLESPLKRTPQSQASLKRRRDEVGEDIEEPDAKRLDSITTPHAKKDGLFMFRTLDASDEEALSAPAKSFAQSLHRQRRTRQPTFGTRAHRSLELGLTPQRSHQQIRQRDPFGLNTFDRKQILAAKNALYYADANSSSHQQEDDLDMSNLHHEAKANGNDQAQRSPAPEPETPRRGLFGSIGRIGSAIINLPRNAVQTFSPRKTQSPSPSHHSPQPSESIHQPSALEPSYPVLDSLEYSPEQETRQHQRQQHAPIETALDGEEEEDSEDERKRKAFIRRWKRAPDPKYEHLHTTPLNGDPANFAYPLPKPSYHNSGVPDSVRRRRERRDLIRGFTLAESKPERAPLFGPDSHEARGTVNSGLGKEFDIGALTGSKRKYDDSNIENEPPQNNFGQAMSNQAYVEDDEEMTESHVGGRTFMPPDDVLTPVAKKQKMTIMETPRSAMKKPLGDASTIGRSTGKSVAFNYNPVSSVKKFTPPPRDLGPAGRYSGGLFSTPSDRNVSPHGSASDTSSFEISPTTQRNTYANRGYHPGDALTKSIKEVMPSSSRDEGDVEFAWSDPNDPKWRPTLGNPRPGSFRVPYDLDEEQESLLDDKTKKLLSQQGDENYDDLKVLEQPQTPRMSHAELPKTGAKPAIDASVDPVEREKLEKARLNVEKHKPRSHSRLSEVYTARSRSPSPPLGEGKAPGMVADDGLDVSESEASTPEDEEKPSWTQDSETGEYICTSRKYPDFLANGQAELVPSFCLRNNKGDYDDKVVGPDNMTERARQAFYAAKYANTFKFDLPQTYEEAGTGSKEIHDLIRRYERENSQSTKNSQLNFHKEWTEHHQALDKALKVGAELIPVYPDRMVEDDDSEF